MPKRDYADFKALDPFFDVVRGGLGDVVDGVHYFDTIDDDALFEFRYNLPGWPQSVRGRANLMALYAGYGESITLFGGDALVVHPSTDSRVVILEYEVHGKVLATGARYDNRFVAVVTLENQKIARWRDYMDSLAACTALNAAL